jgi:hypothetical protein
MYIILHITFLFKIPKILMFIENSVTNYNHSDFRLNRLYFISVNTAIVR